jgi:Flp pilus assembly protein TadG
VEFAIVSLLFLFTSFTIFNFSFWVFLKTALRQAVREGSRYAITGQTGSSGQDAAIKQRVKDNAFHLLDSPADAARIRVEYYAADGSGLTGSNAAGNIVVVSVENYPAFPIAPMFWNAMNINMTVRSVDKVEPFPGAPPARTLPAP